MTLPPASELVPGSEPYSCSHASLATTTASNAPPPHQGYCRSAISRPAMKRPCSTPERPTYQPRLRSKKNNPALTASVLASHTHHHSSVPSWRWIKPHF